MKMTILVLSIISLICINSAYAAPYSINGSAQLSATATFQHTDVPANAIQNAIDGDDDTSEYGWWSGPDESPGPVQYLLIRFDAGATKLNKIQVLNSRNDQWAADRFELFYTQDPLTFAPNSVNSTLSELSFNFSPVSILPSGDTNVASYVSGNAVDLDIVANSITEDIRLEISPIQTTGILLKHIQGTGLNANSTYNYSTVYRELSFEEFFGEIPGEQTVIPEPASVLSLITGLIGYITYRIRRRS